MSFDKISVWVEDTAKLTPTSVHHKALIYYYNYFRLTKIGKVAPNNQVHKLDGSEARVLDYCKPDRPLVLLLAANSWPCYREGTLLVLSEIAEVYKQQVDFLLIYIEEVHAADGWTIRRNVSIKKHLTLQDRIAAATMFSQDQNTFQIVVDNMENTCSEEYAGLPERLYVLLNDQVQMIPGPGPNFINPHQCEQWLDNHFQKTN